MLSRSLSRALALDIAERLEVERRVQTLVVSVGKGLEQSE